jgi:hypothetical protein
MDSDPTGGFKKLNFLLQSPPFPPETFANLLLLYAKPAHAFYDLAADVLAENPGYAGKFLTPVSQQVGWGGQMCASRMCCGYLRQQEARWSVWRLLIQAGYTGIERVDHPRDICVSSTAEFTVIMHSGILAFSNSGHECIQCRDATLLLAWI